MTNQECADIFAQLSEYLDGDLPPNLCADIAAHIEGCAPCVEFVESLRNSIALTTQAAKASLSDEVKTEVRSKLQEAYARYRTRVSS